MKKSYLETGLSSKRTTDRSEKVRSPQRACARNFGSSLTKVFLPVVASAGLMACAPDNPDLVAASEEISADQTRGEAPDFTEYRPKVDVLFVIDNSNSMEKHQRNLRNNIAAFAGAFDKYKALDFQIGVVSVFDSRRFGPVVKDFYPLGKLRPLKGVENLKHPFVNQNIMTPAMGDGYIEVLAQTLYLGIDPRGSDANDLGGPEFEESFAPILAAIDPKVNPGFSRPDAYLAVVILTDVKDESVWNGLPLSADRTAALLREIKGAGRYSVHGALAVDGCATKDAGGEPLNVRELVQRTGGMDFSLCDPDFGVRLAEIGALIQERSSRHVERLKSIPEHGTITVEIGGLLIPQDADSGWTYDPRNTAIVISGKVDLTGAKGRDLKINYVAVDPRRANSGGVSPVTRGSPGAPLAPKAKPAAVSGQRTLE